MSKTKQQLWLFSMLLMYVAIAVAGFTIAYIIKTDFVSKNPPNNQPSVTPSKTKSAPTGWKTYTDTTDNLQFYYPATDKVQTKSYGFGVSSIIFTHANSQTDFQILLLPKSLAQTIGQDFDSYYAMPNNTTKTIKNPLSQDNTTEKFTKIRNKTVDGNRAIDYQSIASNAKPGTIPEIGTFIEAGNNLLLISTEQNNKNNLVKIVGSFRYPE